MVRKVRFESQILDMLKMTYFFHHYEPFDLPISYKNMLRFAKRSDGFMMDYGDRFYFIFKLYSSSDVHISVFPHDSDPSKSSVLVSNVKFLRQEPSIRFQYKELMQDGTFYMANYDKDKLIHFLNNLATLKFLSDRLFYNAFYKYKSDPKLSKDFIIKYLLVFMIDSDFAEYADLDNEPEDKVDEITEEIADILYDVADDIYNMYMAKTLLQQSRRDDVRLFIKDIKQEKYFHTGLDSITELLNFKFAENI